MASAKFPKLEEVLTEMGEWVVKKAKQNLGAKQARKNVRATWANGRPKGFEFKTSRRDLNASGALQKSLGYDLKENEQSIVVKYRGLAYGFYLDKGRYPFMKGIAQGKGIPPSKMKSWIDTRRIQPRDLTTGQFLEKTPSNMRSMAFLMNRKIKWFGIEPTNFFSGPEEEAREKYEQKIIDAFEQDIANQVTA
jgi:hypothetical protein